MKTGIELIAQERQEQIEKHGYTLKSDAEYNGLKEMVTAAIALLEISEEEGFKAVLRFPRDWDQDICQKMADKGYKSRLIIAGALIAAEIDRLQSQ